MTTLFESSTSVCIQNNRDSDLPTLFALRCVAASLRGMRGSGEHNRIQHGEVTATWGVACCLSSRRLFLSNRLDLSARTRSLDKKHLSTGLGRVIAKRDLEKFKSCWVSFGARTTGDVVRAPKFRNELWKSGRPRRKLLL